MLCPIGQSNEKPPLQALAKWGEHVTQPNQEQLYDLSCEEAAGYMEAGMSAKGSMLPKVQASLDFVNALPGRTAIITSLAQAGDALKDHVGTKIRSSEMEASADLETVANLNVWRQELGEEETAEV